MSIIKNITDKIRPETKVIWIESPTNPTLKIIDIAAVCEAVKKVNPDIKILVDNTYASSYITSPLLLGADVSINSLTKHGGGHADITMGIMIFKDKEFYDKIHFNAYTVGTCPSPFDCYLALRSLKTFGLRIHNATRTAYHVAHFLQQHECIDGVFYPGLKNSPGH